MDSNWLDNPQAFEVMEGLLNLCMAREKQLRELTEKLQHLETRLETESRRPKDEPGEEIDKSRGILIVDGSDVLRRQLHGLLTTNGYQVVGSAEDDKEAVRLFRKTRPAIVTVDITNPQTDGFEMIREIKEIDPMAKVIVISADLDKETIVRAIRSGVDDYVAKPIQPKRLLQIIEHLMGSQEPI